METAHWTNDSRKRIWARGRVGDHLFLKRKVILLPAILSSLAIAMTQESFACSANLSGEFRIDQANGDGAVFELQQTGMHVAGSVKFPGVTGTVSGAVSGKSVSLIATFPPGQRVKYSFSIGDDGFMRHGTATELNHAGSFADVASPDNFCR